MTLPDWAHDLHSALDAKLGVEFLSVSPEGASLRVPVEGNTQPYGMWHGGATGVVFESLASLAAFAYARQFGKLAVGTELSASHLTSATTGWLTGTCRAVKLGRSMVSYTCELTDADGRMIAAGRVSCFLRDAPGSATR